MYSLWKRKWPMWYRCQVSCDETSMTAQPKSRPFPTPQWYGPFENMLLLLGTQSPERHLPTRESTATISQILLWRLHKQNTRICWWHAEGATLGKTGNEEEDQPPSPSQNQHRSCWHNHRPVSRTEWPQNSGILAFSTCKGRPPSPLPFVFPCSS